MSTTANGTSSSTFSNDWQRRSCNAVRILAAFELALIFSTWPLWWRNSSFPAIPFIDGLTLPLIADRIAVCVLLITCVLIAVTSGHQRRDRIVRIVSLSVAMILCVTNQHRLQAWHWLFVLGVGTSFLKPENGLQLFRSILASVYVCSALSRMAPTSHQGMSAAIVDQLIAMAGIRIDMSSGIMPEILCHALNIGELIVGLLLIWPKQRRTGILLAMALHATLLLALGPLGLRHHNGVLIWNLCLLCLIPVVFSGPISTSHSTRTNHVSSYHAARLFVWLFPLSGLIGIADNWPAWQLYSTRPESWTLRIREADIRYLDKRIQKHVSEPAPLDEWVVVRLDRWSLAETDSPLYPQDRFQCEVIRQILATMPDAAEFRVEISEPEQWFWWRRVHRTLTTRADLIAECGL